MKMYEEEILKSYYHKYKHYIHYKGSQLLEPLHKELHFGLDQINFVACICATIVFGFFFRVIFTPSRVGVKARHIIEFTLGFAMLFFCFGVQTFCLLFQSLLCYMIMVNFKPGISEKLVFLVAMAIMGLGHIYRLYYDYAGYTMDITGPLMINTQRLSALAFSYADGKKSDQKLPEYISERALSSLPSLLELLSYTFSFHMVICGPLCFYHDYIAFIEGTNVNSDYPNPRPYWTMIKKLVGAVICIAIYIWGTPIYYPDGLLDHRIRDRSPVWYYIFYLVMATTIIRTKYYFAWKLAEAGNISAGLGFNGLDEQGREKWDLIDNVSIVRVEGATNMKMLFGNWNTMTSHWLRHVVYERTNSTFSVFIVSAYWHGFYPGYYITFVGGAFFISLSRMIRQKIQQSFQADTVISVTYDIVTIIVTKILVAYLVVPFLLLELDKSLNFYSHIYYCLHIVGLVVFVFLKFINLSSTQRSKSE